MTETKSTQLGDVTVPLKVLEKLFGKSDTHIQSLVNAGVLVRTQRDKYPLADNVKFYIRHLEQRAKKKGGSEDDEDSDRPDLNHERALLTREQRIARSRENMVAEGLLLDADHQRIAVAQLLQKLVLFLETLPDVVEREANLTPAQSQAMQEAIDVQRDALYASIQDQDGEE